MRPNFAFLYNMCDMKKYLFSLFVAVLATTMGTYARTILIDEGFENGISEEVWTQEFVVGNTPWMVEDISDGLAYPSTAFQGTKRAYLRNNTGETLGYVTRLVSGVMDLRPTKVYMPELTFYYANPKWGADRDTLRVLYRTSSRAAWKQLAELSNPTSDWQRVKLSLPEVGQTYQIAFEGKDNLGHGIVLDSIKLQSAPECTIPYNIIATNKGAGKVNIAWSASWDADYFELVVCKDTIDPDTIENVLPEQMTFHGLINGLVFNQDLLLESGEFYLVYIRSLCEDENSVWSSEATENGPFGFRVRTTKQIPFTENFNYASGVTRDEDWSWGSNTGSKNPFVNTATVGKARANYSPDTTAAVIFSGGAMTALTTPIQADRYAYVATPALTDTTNEEFKVNQCQVHFWSTVYTNTGRKFGRSLMVGVMDDPDDITTFTPVDTVSVWGNQTFQENIVDLSSYNGNGAYVAFVSDFDRDNLFYLDNLTIEYRKAINKVTSVVVNPRDTYADISWDGNASSYNVLVTNAEVNPNNPASAAIVAQATVTANNYRCQGLEPDHSWNRPYYVYVKAAGTEWSYRYPFVTIAAQRAIPYNFNFDAGSTPTYSLSGKQYAEGLGIFGNSASYPAVETSSANSYIGSGYLYMSKMGGKDGWVTLPMVEDLANVQVKFYLSGGATFDQAHATIGVMSNPMDINTFIPVADFQLNTTGYTRCYANFENYSGPEGVIAIMWADVMNMSKFTNNYIDELVVEELSECVPPTNLDLSIEPDSITVRWESALSDEWEFFLSRTALREVDRINKTLDEIAAIPGVVLAQTLSWTNPSSTPVFGFGGLNPHANYYLYVRATCDPDWWTEMAFSTPCRDEVFPYKEMFENYNIGGSMIGCWQIADYLGVDYPTIAQAGTSIASNKALELYSSGTTHRSVAILPTVEGNLSDMLLSFDVRTEAGTASSSALLFVGSMGDIYDANTFVPFDTIEVSGSAFKKVRYILSDCDLRYDNIALSSGLGTLMMNSDVLIDNVELKDPSCIEAYDFDQPVMDPYEIDLVWNGISDNDEWEMKVLTTNAAISAIKNGTYSASSVVVDDTIVTGKHFHIGGLTAQRTYYVYVRALCGDSLWTMTPAYTSCERLDPNKANKETFDSYPSGTSYSESYKANCWSGGNGNPTASTTYLPYVYSSTTYSNSGSNTYRMYGYYSSSSTNNTPAFIVSPEIKCDSLTQVAVTFNMYASTSYSWLLGVMTDPTDLSTFVVIDSVKGMAESVQYSYDLSDYQGQIPVSAKYIAWRTPYNASSYAYLDDVSFVSVACPLTRPSYSELTGSSVRISSGLRTNDQWILLITNKAVSETQLANGTYPESCVIYRDTIDRRSKEVFNLEGKTKYYVATATLCEDTILSQWKTLSFMTPCQSQTPEEIGTITFSTDDGFVTGTGGEMPCWTVGSKTQSASSSYIPYVNNSSTYKHNGNNYLQLYDYVTTTANNIGAYAIMPSLNVDSIQKYQINFWGRSYNSSSYNSQVIVGIVTDPSDLNTFVAIDTLNLSKTAWDPYSVGFENYEGDYMGDIGKNIMFLSDFGVTNYAYISEISLELIPRCRPVSSFTVDSVGEDAAIVSWKGYQNTYRMMVADKALKDSEKPTYRYLLDTIVDHSDEILIKDLLPNTNYYVYAQGICDEGDSTAVSVTYATVHTTCPLSSGVPLPFFDDFEGYEVNDASPGCWQLLYTGSSSSWFAVKEVSSNGTKAIDVYSSSNNAYMVVPKVDANLEDLKLSFDARQYSGGSAKMYVGVMADVNDVTTFVLLNTFTLAATSTFTHCEMLLGDYDLPYDNLVITAGIQDMTPNRYDVYLDNVGLEYVTSCNAPKLKFVGATFNSAELKLTPSNRADSLWQIVVIPDTVYSTLSTLALASYLASAEKMTLDSTRIVLTGLTPATSYYIFARTICGEEEYSSWMRNPLKISTQFYFAEDYFFGFEKTGELWQRSMYSESDNFYLHPALVAGYDNLGEESQSLLYYPHSRENTTEYLYAHTGEGAMLMHAQGNFHGGYVIFPSVGVANDRSFEFKVRPGYSSKATKLPLASTDAVLEIGTIEKDKTFDTYQPLASIRIEALSPTAQATSKKNYLFSNYSLDLDSATIADRQIVFHLPKQSSDSVYLFIDNASLSEPKGFSLVALNKVTADGSSALVEWQSIGGPWNLYITTANGSSVAEYLNLSGVNSQLVENLDPQTDYIARLEAANVPSAAKNYVTTDKLSFRTLCLPMEPNANGTDFVWDFNDVSEWEANDVLAGDANDSLYFKPACFHVGLTYDAPVNGYQWLLQPKGFEPTAALANYSSSRHQEIGRDDSHALRIHTTSANFNSYIVLPELNCGFDSMMIEFYGRCFVNYDQTYGTASNRGKIVDVTYLNDAYSHSIVVGTLTNPLDFSTLQILDTLTYSQTELTTADNVNNDPAGLRYWELMHMPLTGAQGKYIVLFQPAAGLFYLDDLSVKPIGNTMFAPTGTHTTNITATSATMTWNTRHPELTAVVVLLDAVGEEVSRTSVTGTSCELTGLDPAQRYSWYVFQTNGTENSTASKPITFFTECAVITPDYTCGFEPEEGWKAIEGQSANYTQTLCWYYGDAVQNEWKAATFDPYNQANTANNKYSYIGNNALVMRASYSSRATSTYQPYVAMPAMDVAAYDTLQVMFWMRPAYVSAANDSVVTSYTGSTYSKSVIVGTMTDPANPATFVPIDTVTYDGTLSTADRAMPGNNFLFQEAKVELAGATGPYVAFMTSFFEKGSKTQKTSDYIWIDDISFAHRQECKDPTDLAVLQTGTYHAKLTWNGIDSAGSYLLQVSTDPYFLEEEAFAFNDVVETNTYTVEGLSPLTNYIWRVQALCGEKWGESSFSQKATFKTSRSPYFLEEFNGALNANEWMLSKAHADNVVDGTAAVTRGLDSWSFTRTTNNYGLQGSHYVATGYSNDFHWLVTPNFYLPENDSVHFSMDLALTACNTAHTPTDVAVTDNDMKDDYYFMIIISDDGGATWKSANILDKWQNTNPAGKQLRDIPVNGMKVRYSLAQYAGKNVRIGLYREAKTTVNTGIAIHVDNVRFAYYDKTVSEAEACQYEDVTIGNVHLSGDNTLPGIHSYPTPVYVSDEEARAGKRDSVYQLEIEVFPAQESILMDTICEGETYTSYDFLPKERTGIYRRKLHTVEHGCDSIVTLHLLVKERRYAEDTQVDLCPGDTYVWNDKVYNRAGLYRDTLVSSIGCDSVMTLIILNVSTVEEKIYDSSRVELEELPFTYENALHPYVEGQTPIYYPAGTPAGVYVDTVRVAGEQCATVLIHTLTVYDKHQAIDNIFDGKEGARKVIYRDNLYIILNDEWYNAAGKKIADPRR